MVGLVLVSHSARLAEGLREMVAQGAGDDVPLATGGTDDGRLGTSAPLIADAIRPSGVARTVCSSWSISAVPCSASRWRSRSSTRRTGAGPDQRSAARRGRCAGRRPGERRRRNRRGRRGGDGRSRHGQGGSGLTMAESDCPSSIPPVSTPARRPSSSGPEPVPERHRPRHRRPDGEREEPHRQILGLTIRPGALVSLTADGPTPTTRWPRFSPSSATLSSLSHLRGHHIGVVIHPGGGLHVATNAPSKMKKLINKVDDLVPESLAGLSGPRIRTSSGSTRRTTSSSGRTPRGRARSD